KAAIFNPANWIAVGGNTAPQVWPNFDFPAPPNVIDAAVINNNTIRLIFNKSLNVTNAATMSNYQGIAGLQNVQVTANGNWADTVTLTYTNPFMAATTYTLAIDNVADEMNLPMA